MTTPKPDRTARIATDQRRDPDQNAIMRRPTSPRLKIFFFFFCFFFFFFFFIFSGFKSFD